MPEDQAPSPTAFEERPPGPSLDCWECRHWTGGSVIVRGSTIGHCAARSKQTPADYGCSKWERIGRAR